MTNKNETVERVYNDMTERANCLLDEYGHSGEDHLLEYANELHEFASRVEASLAAHKRDIADFQLRYDECVRKFNEADIERVRRRDEVAAKDAEIASLKQKIDEYERQPELMADVATKSLELHKRQDAEIASLRALVKEMSDALYDASEDYTDRDKCRALVAKARETVNG